MNAIQFEDTVLQVAQKLSALRDSLPLKNRSDDQRVNVTFEGQFGFLSVSYWFAGWLDVDHLPLDGQSFAQRFDEIKTEKQLSDVLLKFFSERDIGR